MNSAGAWWLFHHFSDRSEIYWVEREPEKFFMCHSCSLLLHFLTYKVWFLCYQAEWPRPHPLFSHHPPCLQELWLFERNSLWIWGFPSPECTNRFSSFQVLADFVAPNLMCWSWLQCMASQYHSLHAPVVMLCSHTTVGKVQVWPLCVNSVLYLPFSLSG